MQITEIRSRAVSIPLDVPVVSAIRQSERVEIVIVEVLTSTDIVGQSYVQAFGVPQARAVRAIVDYLAGVLRGESALLTQRCYQLMQRAINLLGRGGLATFALSGIDCALWDIMGKVAQLPLAVLLGAAGDRCSAYQSAGLWLLPPGQELADQAQQLAASGFGGVKMRVGRADLAQDVEAARIVREAIGPDPLLLIDANQAWNVPTAIAAGRILESFQPHWLEEPVDHDDLDGHARVTRELNVTVASGENVYLPHGFLALFQAGGCGIAMPDVQRVGGVTGWMRVAGMAEAYRIPLASHLFPEISVHLLAASPTAHLLEYMPWAQPIMAEKLVVEGGAAVVPHRPGLGLVFDEEAVTRFQFD